MQEEVRSPVTQSSNVKLFEVIPSSIVIENYKNDCAIDVSRFFKNDSVQIFKCLDTGLLFYYPPYLVGDEKLYEELQSKGTYYSQWNWEHDVVYDYIKKSDTVLEVGCGTGSFLEALKKDHIESYGLELNNKAVEVCTSKGLNVYNELLEEHVEKRGNSYDVVCSFQVLEHIVNIRNYIEACLQAAKTGGLIMFGVPNNNPYIFKRDKFHTLNLPPHHMSMWSKQAFEHLPRYFDMELVDVRVENLLNKRYYLQTFLKYNNLSFLKKHTHRISDHTLNLLSNVRKWQGRNLVAIFKKK